MSMNYQRQESNGTVLETINGKHYVNGVEVETGKFHYSIYFMAAAFTFFGFVGGFITGVLS